MAFGTRLFISALVVSFKYLLTDFNLHTAHFEILLALKKRVMRKTRQPPNTQEKLRTFRLLLLRIAPLHSESLSLCAKDHISLMYFSTTKFSM